MADETRAAGEELHGLVSDEHRRLDDLFAEIEASFAERRHDSNGVRDAFAALCEEFDVHLEQEDRLYYASLGALCPELGPEIRAIADAHRHFRREMAAIGDRLERDDFSAARQRIGALAEGFRLHEAIEESLLQRVAGEP
jgi:hypothetical protein